MADPDPPEFKIGLDAPHIEGQMDIFEVLAEPQPQPPKPKPKTIAEIVADRLGKRAG